MSVLVRPKNTSKEDWLAKYAITVTESYFINYHIADDQVNVLLAMVATYPLGDIVVVDSEEEKNNMMSQPSAPVLYYIAKSEDVANSI